MSLIRTAQLSFAAKPPNTKRVALPPMRDKASMAFKALRDHWHIDDHAVAALPKAIRL